MAKYEAGFIGAGNMGGALALAASIRCSFSSSSAPAGAISSRKAHSSSSLTRPFAA